MTVRHAQVFPEGTVWTDDTGAQVWDHTACQCEGFLPRGLLDAVEGAS